MFLSSYVTVSKDLSKYPPFSIFENKLDSQWIIEFAVAGFSRDELNVTLQDEILSITGKKSVVDERVAVYRGIASRSFSQKFNLPQYAIVDEVTLKDGILSVTVSKDIPIEKQPKTFLIK